MKKVLAVLIFAVLLTGCAKQESAPVESAAPPATQQTRQMQTAAPEPETATAEPTIEPTTEPLVEIDELPFHNKAAYKVYEKQTNSGGKSYLTVKTYDEHDNVILREDFDETGEVYYSKETAFEYDEEGNAIREYCGSDAYYETEYQDGKEVRWLYYDEGELLSESTYEYYPNGDFKCVWSSHDGCEPYAWMIFEYEYDEQGRIIVSREKNDDDELKYTKYLTYDDSGNVAESVVYRELSYYENLDESREVERYKWTHDADGNVLTFVKTYETRDGTVAYENSGEYKYDEQGRVVSMEERYASGEIVLTEYTYEMIESAE